MKEQEFFRPLQDDYHNMPQEINYMTEEGHNYNVIFGTEFGHPATRYTVTDVNGRIIKEGGSFALNFGYALRAGLGQEAGTRAIRVLAQEHQVILGSLATSVEFSGDGFGGRA